MLRRAAARTGTPYAYGGGSPAGPGPGSCDDGNGYVRGRCADSSTVGFDCSSLVQYAYWPHTQLPRTAAAQYKATAHRPVSRGELRPGDLLFWPPERVHLPRRPLRRRRPGPPRPPHRPPGRGRPARPGDAGRGLPRPPRCSHVKTRWVRQQASRKLSSEGSKGCGDHGCQGERGSKYSPSAGDCRRVGGSITSGKVTASDTGQNCNQNDNGGGEQDQGQVPSHRVLLFSGMKLLSAAESGGGSVRQGSRIRG
ncbi:NlpC/P60 family protein [Streptomyces sp. NPDC006544]|uniref:C40 family peptidase n=1 Tax=Streptomyces sp. NPDC006544 TaxID=3154583 RepID=UPI0033A1A60D